MLNSRDLIHLSMLGNLKKLDLSSNSLESLPPAKVFSGLHSLHFLYLHNNKLGKWQDLQSLTGLPKILHVTLFDNPVCAIPGYRHFLVNSIPCLKALDHYVITDEERIEDATFGYRFRSLNEFMRLHIPDYFNERSADQHLYNLEVDIYRLKRIFERNSPSILIQSLYRGYRSRNFTKIYFNERAAKIEKIQKAIRGWLARRRFEKDLRDLLSFTGQEDLLKTNEELRRREAAGVIFKFIFKCICKKRAAKKRQAAALKIQTYYRMYFVKNSSFVNALRINESPRIYFLKE